MDVEARGDQRWRGLPVPAQLPPTVNGFVGRGNELAALDRLLLEDGPRAVVISAVSGAGGVGKTTLAVHWAHRVAASFPDGQLYLNLRGFDPAMPPMAPGEALQRFFDAFGVAAERIPADLDGQTAFYRSLLAGGRVLVVLDNARDAEQVRPLLPGTVGCAVAVTSRNRLTSLVAHGAHAVALDLLAPSEARALLEHRLGPDRIAADPAAVDEIVDRCGRLPLALSVVAARAATRPRLALATLAEELRDRTGTLHAFQDTDPAADVRTVLSGSYRMLSAAGARLFRRLGLHPGVELSVPAVASLAATPRDRTRAGLDELAQLNLLTDGPDRYRRHDLLRDYAAERAEGEDPEPVRRAARHRLLDHYLHSAHAAALALFVYIGPLELEPVQPGVEPERPGTGDEAMAWLVAEHANLLAAIRLAERERFLTHAWQLAWCLSRFHSLRGLWHDQTTVQRIALAAAHRTGDRAGEAHALHGLGLGASFSGRTAEARPLLTRALELFAAAGERVHESVVHQDLSWVCQRQGDLAGLLEHGRRSLQLCRDAGHFPGVVVSSNDVGYAYALLGRYDEALHHCEFALAELRSMGDRNGESAAQDSLGTILAGLGQADRAIAAYERAIELSRELGDRYNEAGSLVSLGDVHFGQSDLDSARRVWRRALDILAAMGHPDADGVREKLARLAAVTG